MRPYRGRGRGMMRGGFKAPFHHQKMFIPHIPFDLVQCESTFPRAEPAPDDKSLTEALLKRNQELTPSALEQTAVSALVTKIQTAVESLVVNPGNFEAAQIEEIRQVGSFKMGTMMAGNNVADLVAVLKTLPTQESVSALGNKLLEDMRAVDPREVITMLTNENGFEISSSDATVQVRIATIPKNRTQLEEDLHLDWKILSSNLGAIRHARWFEENAFHSSVKVLVRIYKDMRNRFEGFNSLNPWLISLLSHYATMNNPSMQALPIASAFRRSLQLLSSGLFLPGSAGIMDPCENSGGRVHTSLSLQQQDEICCSAQTLLRILSHGGLKKILGLERSEDITQNVSVWDGTVVTPASIVYTPPQLDEVAEAVAAQT